MTLRAIISICFSASTRAAFFDSYGATYTQLNRDLSAILKVLIRTGQEKRKRGATRIARARAQACVAMSLNDWRLLENRSTSIYLEARLRCTYYTHTSSNICIPDTYASCTSWILHNRRRRRRHRRAVPRAELKLYRGKSVLSCLV